ncbi:hypothetical protein LZ30DRAFT_122852 [Colletotrichum cereale]|nr:hypothetical protein LZ30DRAFT_122852 [Colletotrichum cereale]
MKNMFPLKGCLPREDSIKAVEEEFTVCVRLDLQLGFRKSFLMTSKRLLVCLSDENNLTSPHAEKQYERWKNHLTHCQTSYENALPRRIRQVSLGQRPDWRGAQTTITPPRRTGDKHMELCRAELESEHVLYLAISSIPQVLKSLCKRRI